MNQIIPIWLIFTILALSAVLLCDEKKEGETLIRASWGSKIIGLKED